MKKEVCEWAEAEGKEEAGKHTEVAQRVSSHHGNRGRKQMSHAPTYLFIVYERGGVKTAGCPLEKAGRLLRSHINQHTLGDQECWQSYEKKKGTSTCIHQTDSLGMTGWLCWVSTWLGS